MGNPEIRKAEQMARRLKILKTKQDQMQAEIDQIEDDLKGILTANRLDELQAGPFRIIYKMIMGNRFDSNRFKAEHADIYQRYMVPRSYMSFRIT